ncbi:hypothetical protein RCG22_01410 [Neobacillus sp. OS1-33]|nr:hypothetical protein [Neobacillus sp. OS1-33]WML26333.1 hypothetical protein RCG22_01410 [Neobacillus sp. OS1-33]
MDKKTMNKLLGALERMNETAQKMQQSKELKIWSDISVPITLKEALSRLTKDELSDIRKNLEIQGASALKKGELIDLLSMRIPLLLEKMSKTMDHERYNLIQKIIRNGGSIVDPKLSAPQLDYFRTSGILFTGTYEGKRIVVIPEEIVKNQFFRENDKQLTEISRRNTEWIRLTHGFLYYYGTLTINDLFNLLEKYLNKRTNFSEYLSVMEQARGYYKRFRMDHIGFSNGRVLDPEKVKREHQIRKDLPFFQFTKEQLYRAGEPEFIERNDSFNRFVYYLIQNYEISRQEAYAIAEECVHVAQMGESPNIILQFLQGRIELDSIETLQACMDKVVDLMNNTRQWFLKGYSSVELRPVEKKSLRPLPDRKNNVVDFTKKEQLAEMTHVPVVVGRNIKSVVEDK